VERLYIIQGEHGLFKTGRTTRFTERLRQLVSDFQRRGDRVIQHQAFDCAQNAKVGEQAMLRQLVAAGYQRGFGDEWFHDVNWIEATRLAEESIRYATDLQFELTARTGEFLEPPRIRALWRAIRLVGGQGELADRLGVSHVCISLILSRPNGHISPALCSAIEVLTRGRVLRQELRPDDWHHIWPDATKDNPAHVAYMQRISAVAA
jgi:DNA-binding transcriptional regulator YdaS (Cro superfamily)